MRALLGGAHSPRAFKALTLMVSMRDDRYDGESRFASAISRRSFTASTHPLAHWLHSHPYSRSHLVDSSDTLLRLGVDDVRQHRDLSPTLLQYREAPVWAGYRHWRETDVKGSVVLKWVA